MDNSKLHIVAVTGIVHKDGKFLILKRSGNEIAYPEKWTVPGGKFDISDLKNIPKDTSDAWYGVIDKTLRREIKEETGIEVGKIYYLTDLAFVRPDGYAVLTLSYWCHWKSGDVVISDDFSEYIWVTAEEARKYDMIEGIAEEIAQVEKILKGE